MRLIDETALARQIESEYHGAISDSELKVYQVLQKLYDAPTVDAVPAKSGEWIETESDELVCSRCGKEAPYISHFQETFDYDWDENLVSTGYEETRDYQRTKYCPNCGARMKEADYE